MKKFQVEVRLFGQDSWSVSPRLSQVFGTVEAAEEEAEAEFPKCFYGLATRVVEVVEVVESNQFHAEVRLVKLAKASYAILVCGEQVAEFTSIVAAVNAHGLVFDAYRSGK